LDEDSAAIEKNPKDTHATEDGSPSQEDQIPRPFKKTPAELHIMIADEVVQQHFDSIIVVDNSGERLRDIWSRVYHLHAPNDLAATERRTWRQYNRMTNLGSPIFDVKYVFSPQIPELLQAGHEFRKEGREAFGKLAKRELADANIQNHFDREFCKATGAHYVLADLLNSLQKLHGVPITMPDERVIESWEEMQAYANFMVCNTLRWYALRHVCELLELELEP
jgi:hypothetical protein